ncbi:unnamed protein product [Adineta steineri]|uniref:Major facilitator superfamily (MFS) profile domain-containing protein n=1 Tax=Adineta steineri TaxID=433720 RepID=A0A813U2X1_9BILA|nr:unnamed protein product [Adineta steineri]
MYLPAIVSVNLYFEKKSAFALGIAISGSGVGSFVLFFIMDAVVNIQSGLSYPSALLIEAAIILFGIVCGFLMTPLPQEPSEQRRLQRQAEKNLISSNALVTSENNIANEAVDLKILHLHCLLYQNFSPSLGFNVIYNFADDLANDSKVIKGHRAYIVMSISLSNILGRVIIGYLGDRKWINHLLLFIITLIISGIATIIAPFCSSSVIPHICYASLFGFSSGGYFTLTPIVLVDIVGKNKLSDAFGVLLLFIGVAMAIGTPIVGAMRDAFSDFTQPFLWPYLIFAKETKWSSNRSEC